MLLNQVNVALSTINHNPIDDFSELMHQLLHSPIKVVQIAAETITAVSIGETRNDVMEDDLSLRI